MIGEIIICCPLIVSESGFDHVPTNLWRASDLKIRGHETLQNNWLACGSSGGLHYVAAEAGRQVLAKVPHLYGGQRGRRQPRSQVLPLACDQVLRHAGATGGHRYVIKPKIKAFFFVDFDVGLLYNLPWPFSWWEIFPFEVWWQIKRIPQPYQPLKKAIKGLQKDVISLSTLLSFLLDDKLSYLKFDKSYYNLCKGPGLAKGCNKNWAQISPRSLCLQNCVTLVWRHQLSH